MFYRALARGLATSGKEHGVKAVVVPEIDAYNVLSILRGKFWELDEKQAPLLMLLAVQLL